MITLYNAIAGSCAEDEANAGGGGTPPAGIPAPSQIYTAESSGGSVGIIINTYAVNFFQIFINGAVPNNIPALSGKPSSSASITATNQTLVGQPFAISVETVIPATSFNSIMNTGFTGGQPINFLFVAIGFFLESPNATITGLPNYNILAVQSNITDTVAVWQGDPATAPFNSGYTGNNWPLQDSTDFTNGHLLAFKPVSNGVVGGLGAHGTLTSGQMQSPQGNTFSGVIIQNTAGRGGGSVSANAGEFARVIYQFDAQVGGSTETTIVEYKLTLS